MRLASLSPFLRPQKSSKIEETNPRKPVDRTLAKHWLTLLVLGIFPPEWAGFQMLPIPTILMEIASILSLPTLGKN